MALAKWIAASGDENATVRAVEDRKARGVAWTIVPVLLALRFGVFPSRKERQDFSSIHSVFR